MLTLLRTKSFWVGLAAICTAVGLAFEGTITWGEAVQTIVLGVVAITGRHAIVKLKP